MLVFVFVFWIHTPTSPEASNKANKKNINRKKRVTDYHKYQITSSIPDVGGDTNVVLHIQPKREDEMVVEDDDDDEHIT